MSTTTVAPQETVKKAPLILTPQAIAKVREIMAPRILCQPDYESELLVADARASSTRWPSRIRAV